MILKLTLIFICITSTPPTNKLEIGVSSIPSIDIQFSDLLSALVRSVCQMNLVIWIKCIM